MAQHVLAASVDKSWKQFNGAWKRVRARGSKKYVHDLRVGTRRLIAVLELVRTVSGDATIARVQKRFKKVLKRMGDLRDAQVLLENLSQLRSIDPLKDFEQRLKRRERDATDDVRSSLKRRKKRRLWNDLAGVRSRLDRQTASDDRMVHRRIEALLAKRHKDFWTARIRFNPADEESLHKMRIALKQLRYVVEAAEPVLGRWAKQCAHQMQAAQTLMGNTRDLQILRTRLQKWADKRTPKVAEAMAPQLASLDDKRHRLASTISKSTARLQHLEPPRRQSKPKISREATVVARVPRHSTVAPAVLTSE